MTTEMKRLLALLLLGCCVLAVQGASNAGKKDFCTKGMAALNVFMDRPGCEGPDLRMVVRELTTFVRNNLTVHNLNYVFTNFCSTVMPRLVTCFEGNIANCSRAERDSLMKAARQTGFACEPNTNRTNAVLDHILSRLTNVEVAQNIDCDDQQTLMGIYERCGNRSLEAIGVSRANFSDYMQNLNIEQLATKIQIYFSTFFSCTATGFRVDLNCPQWRRKVMQNFIHSINPPILGHNMTFNITQIDQLFDWPQQSITQTGVSWG